MHRSSVLFLAGLLVGIAGTTAAASLAGSSVFPDVPQGSYYDQAIGEVYAAGLITGYANGTFGPNDPVTRGQLAVIMQRLRVELGLAESDGGASSVRSSRSRSVSSSSESTTASSASSSSSSSSSSSVSIGPAGAVRFTGSAASVGEDAGTVTLSIVRTNGNQGTVQVTYEVQADTANTDDFETATATVTFPNKTTSALIEIKLKNDTSTEGDERFKVVLKNPTNSAVLGNPSTIVVTIRDDETVSSSSSSSRGGSLSSQGQTVGLSATEYSIGEHMGALTVSVVRQNGTSGTTSVVYETVDGSAKSGTDYSGVSGTLTFAGGESVKTFQIPVSDEATIDGNRIFTVRLRDATGTSTMGISSATVTTYDNEALTIGSGTLRFADDEFIAYESQGRAVVTVRRVGGAKGAIAVNFSTSDGTARAGNDYVTTAGTLTFLEGEAAKTFSVPLYSDTEVDADEGINLSLSGVTGGAQMGSPSTAMIRLFD